MTDAELDALDRRAAEEIMGWKLSPHMEWLLPEEGPMRTVRSKWSPTRDWRDCGELLGKLFDGDADTRGCRRILMNVYQPGDANAEIEGPGSGDGHGENARVAFVLAALRAREDR